MTIRVSPWGGSPCVLGENAPSTRTTPRATRSVSWTLPPCSRALPSRSKRFRPPGAVRGKHPGGYPPGRPGRGRKPHSVPTAFDCAPVSVVAEPRSSHPLGLLRGRRPFHHFRGNLLGCSDSSCPAAVSLLLRCSDSRPAGLRPPPWFPEWGLSSAPGPVKDPGTVSCPPPPGAEVRSGRLLSIPVRCGAGTRRSGARAR
jgi:hypothetical protein